MPPVKCSQVRSVIWQGELRFVANAESSHSLDRKKSEPSLWDRLVRWQPETVTIFPAHVATSWEDEMSPVTSLMANCRMRLR
jgi:hypothetical protein